MGFWKEGYETGDKEFEEFELHRDLTWGETKYNMALIWLGNIAKISLKAGELFIDGDIDKFERALKAILSRAEPNFKKKKIETDYSGMFEKVNQSVPAERLNALWQIERKLNEDMQETGMLVPLKTGDPGSAISKTD